MLGDGLCVGWLVVGLCGCVLSVGVFGVGLGVGRLGGQQLGIVIKN